MIKDFKILLLICTFSQLLIFELPSQIKQIGIFGGIDFLSNSIGSDAVPYPIGTIQNLRMKAQNTTGWSAGLKFDYNLIDKIFLESRLSYKYLPLELNSTEAIKLIENEQVIDAHLRTVIKSEFNNFNASLELGNDFGFFDISIGTVLGVPLSNRYALTQNLIDNPDFDILLPGKDTNLLTRKYSKLTYHPFARLTLKPFSADSKSETGVIPALELTYIYPLNSMSDEIDWKYSSLSLSISLSFSLEQKENQRAIRNETIFFRDTTMVFSQFVTNDSIYMNSQRIENRVLDDVIIIETYQNWVRVIPKPKSLLNGELIAEFIYPDNTASKECRVGYLSQINNWSNLELFKKKIRINKISDTTVSIELPVLRLHPTIITEAGLSKLSLNLYQDFFSIFSKDIDSNFPETIDIDLNKIINTSQLSQNQKTIEIWLTLIDNDQQVFHSHSASVTYSNTQANKTKNINDYLILDEKLLSNPEFKKQIMKSHVICIHANDESIAKSLISIIKTDVEYQHINLIKNKIPAEFNRDNVVIIEISNQ